ncbi:MAG: hypothetical protein A2754_01990 [Candidatus Magasanikbacteria bacterium RIFCSPHIGHO2_01_FULL_47_8]|uniref:Uncharacterized protein n=1 Tax=Candidatus Magasanikbacteria bacterium RIFCSPHIGHO2_01_FULL_47_8 TaxID=1798673 RepID=A0A1F6MBU0_9BACT|nr:MAG: hypothetical protein A2754_01990 [Candidatus Magasanikbacteria bacterium RIFCSPHIGHO2_01_FULL_47_8]
MFVASPFEALNYETANETSPQPLLCGGEEAISSLLRKGESAERGLDNRFVIQTSEKENNYQHPPF